MENPNDYVEDSQNEELDEFLQELDEIIASDANEEEIDDMQDPLSKCASCTAESCKGCEYSY